MRRISPRLLAELREAARRGEGTRSDYFWLPNMLTIDTRSMVSSSHHNLVNSKAAKNASTLFNEELDALTVLDDTIGTLKETDCDDVGVIANRKLTGAVK